MRKGSLSILLASALIMSPLAIAEGTFGVIIGFETPATYDANGFDADGIHKDTGTQYDPDGYPQSGNQPPVINTFSASPNSGEAPLSVTFSHSVTDDVGTPTINIDYGDGSSGTSPNHVYGTAGSFTATLSATDERGAVSTATESINTSQANVAPTINSFTVSPASGDAPLAVTFAHNITDDNGTPSISIDYGDGNTGSSLSHTYANAGSYTATLTATDAGGLTDTATVGISASTPNVAPTINSFTASPASGTAPLAVTFAHNITDDNGTPSISIDYGDGNTGSSLSHTYANAGNYTATLTATDAGGLTDTATVAISATSAQTCEFSYNPATALGTYWATTSFNTAGIYWQDVLIGNPAFGDTEFTSGGYKYTRGAHDQTHQFTPTLIYYVYRICREPI